MGSILPSITLKLSPSTFCPRETFSFVLWVLPLTGVPALPSDWLTVTNELTFRCSGHLHLKRSDSKNNWKGSPCALLPFSFCASIICKFPPAGNQSHCVQSGILFLSASELAEKGNTNYKESLNPPWGFPWANMIGLSHLWRGRYVHW